MFIRTKATYTALCFFCLAAVLLGSQKPGTSPQRVIAIVPMIGSGTVDDPRRPLFFPTPTDVAKAPDPNNPPAVLSYRYELADDGNTAIVEFSGRDRVAIRRAIKSSDPGVRLLDLNSNKPGEVEKQLKLLKQSFNLQHFLNGDQAQPQGAKIQ